MTTFTCYDMVTVVSFCERAQIGRSLPNKHGRVGDTPRMDSFRLRPWPFYFHITLRMEKALFESVWSICSRRGGIRADCGQRVFLYLSPGVLLHFVPADQVERQR